MSLSANIVKVTRPYDSVSKRSELIRSAKELFYRRGYHGTSLAEVASQADIPLGNVHYYFSTKQALAEAVVSAYKTEMRAAFVEWETAFEDPVLRLRALALSPLAASDNVIQSGCPQGSLCQELEKMEPGAHRIASGSPMLELWVDWSAAQFTLLGLSETEARVRAAQLVAAVQGTMLLAHALHSADVLRRGLESLESALAAEWAAVPRR